jgi:SAM-dependent methyltransferase
MLRNLGYRCEMTDPTPAMELCFPDSSWDFAFSGHFPSQARDRTARVSLAKEMFRVLRGGGSLLLAIGNRLCPVDLTRNGGMFHGAGADYCLSLKEMRGILMGEAGFANVGLLNVNGHFGWGSLPSIIRPLGRILDAHWRYLAIPSREWIYASPLNPTLLLWINKP